MPIIVFYEYVTWQYGEGVREFVRAWQNVHWFLWRVFSVSLMLRTFFAPFRRTGEAYGRGFDLVAMAQTFLINLVTRFVGVVVRSVLLAVALVFQGAVLLGGGVLFLWFLLTPVVIPASLLAGILIILF